ncbi:MAG: DUF4364 family protein [Acutalibacteraceae bacterium]|nr:DUF4364 family protein [Clostridia bacterium]MEE1126988.1 DUF4364 family protein [Acutalibacteraceae bacterium]MBQ2001232.1 DUF4364 family protein [Clostridia bacterium]MBQ2319248.1 DUF4364 family protein [Clostridia bacterium]MBQ2387606.1 DUF4364 family protein [Clostridia bacterium]
MADAFTAGVAPGGLISSQHVKLMVCYILARIGKPISRDDMLSLLQYEEIANYFEVVQAIDDLNKGGTIRRTDAPFEEYEITNDGEEVVAELYRDLPYTMREKALKAAIKMMARNRSEAENRVEMVETDVGVNVTCSVMDIDRPILTITLLVPDMEQANLVKETFLDNPLKVYSGSIALLTGDYKAVKKQFEAE